MFDESPTHPKNNPNSAALQRLTMTPSDAIARATSHSKDVAHSFIMTCEDSQIAVSWAVRSAMERLNISVFQLHEKTGLSCDLIDAFIEGQADISDSEPLSKLEQALGVSLNHL